MKNKPALILSYPRGILKLPAVAFFLYKSVQQQKNYIKQHVLPEFQPFLKNTDGSISSDDIKKITHYYALGVPAILGYGFSLLRNLPLSSKERACMTYLGGISGLLDDLFDDANGDGNGEYDGGAHHSAQNQAGVHPGAVINTAVHCGGHFLCQKIAAHVVSQQRRGEHGRVGP